MTPRKTVLPDKETPMNQKPQAPTKKGIKGENKSRVESGRESRFVHPGLLYSVGISSIVNFVCVRLTDLKGVGKY